MSFIAGSSCTYGGQYGLYPEATECRQAFSNHNMLAMTEDLTPYVDTFRIPSACVCHLVDEELFRA